MKRLLSVLTGVLGLAHFASAEVDLTPHYIDTFADGIAFHRLYFTLGEKKFLLSLSRDTEVTPDSGGALFKFGRLPSASFLAVRSRHSPEDKFEGPPLERYRESARRLIPVQGRGVLIREEQADPFPINNWKSYRFIISFDIGTVHYLQSVTYLNLTADDQITLLVSSPEKDFKEADVISFNTFRTWQEMLPGDDKPDGKL
jgi:hypothetical protein